LYGADDLIKSLPKTIKQLHVTNTSSTPVYLDLEAVSQFTELDTLLLQNVVKEIPESIGNLRNLDILSLTDNKDLRTLPESILNLENLTFLVLTGSGVQLSGEMAEAFMETADGVYSRF
jgi:Leucine-rich repeat (LRR) protein